MWGPELGGDYQRKRIGELRDVLPRLSVAVAVTNGPFTLPGKFQLPEPSAVANPSKVRPSFASSEKTSTLQPGQAVPEADPTSGDNGAGMPALPPACRAMPIKPLLRSSSR